VAGTSRGPTGPVVSPARACAFRVLRRVFEEGAYADRALNAEAAGLDGRDRALATALAYGAVQRRRTLDHVAAALSTRPLARLEPPVLAALRLGLLQILFLGGIAEHAAVHETVELAKVPGRPGGGGAPLVNAVLRRATREGPGIVAALDDATPAGAAISHSVPDWIAELWWDELGADRARGLLRAINQPAESALRVNTLRTTRAQVIERLPVPAHAAEALPEGVVLTGAFDAHASELFRAGEIMPQSRASMLVSRLLSPEPHERVLDLCAAPGGKTTHLAALMEGVGTVIAVERNPQRADGLRRTCRRMGADLVEVRVRDAATSQPATFDRVLVDPPCTGLGTLQSRPDLRWRTSPERLADVAALQARILAAGAAATRPGGTLVYSVCTISSAEGSRQIEQFLSRHGGWEADDLAATYPQWVAPDVGGTLQLLPGRDGTDGFFIARLRRSAQYQNPG
jgi:16S rRNA (cytosine967-C5)-methyltransferase